MFALTNVLVVFGGSEDPQFNREVSDLIGAVRVSRTSWQTGPMTGRTVSGDDIDILRPEEIRRLPERRALVIAENGRPIIARLHRCIDGRGGRTLLDQQAQIRRELARRPSGGHEPDDLVAVALNEARVRGLTGGPEDYR